MRYGRQRIAGNVSRDDTQIIGKKDNVRSVDVAEELGYSKPSVSALAGDFMPGSVTTKIFEKHLTKTLDKEFCGVYNENAKGKSGINRLWIFLCNN